MILVIQGQLLHYRNAFFNALSRLDAVTVVHSGAASVTESDCFDEIILPLRKAGPFRFQLGLHKTIKELEPQVVIAMFDVRWVNSVLAMYHFDRRLKWVWWGLDRGHSRLATRFKIFLARRSNPIVFYNQVSCDSFAKNLGSREQCFVANNTFDVPFRAKSFLHPIKNRILNVGALDARKQNDVTIHVLKRIYDDMDTNIRFTLIGDGQERENLIALVEELSIHDRIEFLGPIEDPTMLTHYYAEAIASVSFGQAGLAVLQSMAFGVPFITKRNAISGGEKFNIIDGENGIFVSDDPAALEMVLRRLFNNIDEARCLGEAAYSYYTQKATVQNMVSNFAKAIDSVDEL